MNACLRHAIFSVFLSSMTSTGPGLGNRVGTQFTLLPSGLRTVNSPRPDLAELPISQLSTSFISAHSALSYNIGKSSNNNVYVFIDYLLFFFFHCSVVLLTLASMGVQDRNI